MRTVEAVARRLHDEEFSLYTPEVALAVARRLYAKDAGPLWKDFASADADMRARYFSAARREYDGIKDRLFAATQAMIDFIDAVAPEDRPRG